VSKRKSLPKKERELALALLSVGVSRESASRSIGYPSMAVDDLFHSDESFAKSVLKAEEESEQYYLSRIREASQDPRGWRAAAWMLERRQPERYGINKPDLLTEESIKKFMEYFGLVLFEEVADISLRVRILDRMAEYFCQEGNSHEKGGGI
jgi:hypothetical protein